MKRILPCILVFLLMALTRIYSQQPGWTNSLVIDPEYYTGISSCSKSEPDYQGIAAKKALGLIAEQIQTTIISSNEMYSSEHNFNFNEEFIQSVKTSSSITLQDYEIYQAWENEESYYVYYRLSKQVYHDNLMLAYDRALDHCMQKTTDAETFLTSLKIDAAIGAYLEASKFLEPLVSNSFIPEKYAMVVNEWNGIQSQLLKILFDFRVIPLRDKIQTTRGKLLAELFEVKVRYEGKEDRISLEDIPVVFDLAGNLNAFEFKVKNTDNEGIARNQLVNLYNESLAYTIYCKIDFGGYLGRFGDYQVMQSPEFSNLASNTKILVEVIPVTVAINSSEYTFGRKNSSLIIKNELSTFLRSRNIAVIENEKKCDYLISLVADTRRGNVYDEVCSAFLDINFEVVSRSDDSVVVSGNLDPVKGLSLSFETAAGQAYKNVKEEIRSGLGKTLLPYLK